MVHLIQVKTLPKIWCAFFILVFLPSTYTKLFGNYLFPQCMSKLHCSLNWKTLNNSKIKILLSIYSTNPRMKRFKTTKLCNSI
jgi:hypothetical protein